MNTEDKRTQYHRVYQKEYYKRNKIIKVTLSNDSYVDLSKMSDLEGKKPAVLARALIETGTNREPYISSQLEADLRALRFLMRNVANNLNQMAHHSNTVRFVVDEKGVFSQLQSLEDIILDYTKGRLGERIRIERQNETG